MASTTAPAIFFFFSSRRRHTRYIGDWSSDVCSSDLFTNDLAVGFRDGCAQADGQVIRKVIAANRNSAAMAHHAAAKDEQFRGAAADVQQAAAEIAFVLRETGFRGSKWFENRIVDKNAGLVRGGDEILRGGNGGSHQMDVDFQALADHADGVAYAVLRIHHEFVRKDVEDFAGFGKRDVAGGVQ